MYVHRRGRAYHFFLFFISPTGCVSPPSPPPPARVFVSYYVPGFWYLDSTHDWISQDVNLRNDTARKMITFFLNRKINRNLSLSLFLFSPRGKLLRNEMSHVWGLFQISRLEKLVLFSLAKCTAVCFRILFRPRIGRFRLRENHENQMVLLLINCTMRMRTYIWRRKYTIDMRHTIEEVCNGEEEGGRSCRREKERD